MTPLSLTGKLIRRWNQKLISVDGPFSLVILDVLVSSDQSTPELLRGGKSNIYISLRFWRKSATAAQQCNAGIVCKIPFVCFFFCDLVTKYLLDYNINAQRWDFTHSYGCAGVSGSGAGGLDCSSQTLSPLNSLMPSAVCWENNTK